jgi:catechol 2,3-dioxygenase-like lactoylglutathione lyase family enzyme
MPFVAGMVGLGGMDKDGAMLGHLGINVPDLEAARRYYRELLPLVGFEPFVDDEDQFAFVPAEGKRGTSLFFYPTRSPEPYSRHDTTGLQHLAFTVPTRSAVHAVHKWARGTGCTVLHEPRQFPEYPPPYFATFWLDPFGMMLESRLPPRSGLTVRPRSPGPGRLRSRSTDRSPWWLPSGPGGRQRAVRDGH